MKSEKGFGAKFCPGWSLLKTSGIVFGLGPKKEKGAGSGLCPGVAVLPQFSDLP